MVNGAISSIAINNFFVNLPVVQEAMKRILKQNLHHYEVYIKSYKVIKCHVFHVRS